jgi:hypothetical protein
MLQKEGRGIRERGGSRGRRGSSKQQSAEHPIAKLLTYINSIYPYNNPRIFRRENCSLES